MTKAGLVLVGGTGRSGTTLMRQLLSEAGVAASFGSEARVFADKDGVFDMASLVSNPYSIFEYDTAVRDLQRLLKETSKRWRLGELALVASSGANTTSSGGGTRSSSAITSARRLGRKALSSRVVPRYAGVGLEAAVPRWDEHCDGLFASLTSHSYPGRWSGTPQFHESEIFFAPQQEALAALRRFVQSVLSDAAGPANVVVDDTPHGVLKLDAARTVSSGTRAIVMKRDPFDVVASMMRTRWAPSNALACAEILDHHVRALGEIEGDGDVLVIELESLLADPTEDLDRICSHLGVGQISWPETIPRRLDTVGRGRTELAPEDVAVIRERFGWVGKAG